MNDIGKVVRIDERQLKSDMKAYSETPKQELLRVFSLDHHGMINASMKPTDQNQHEDHVEFSTGVVHEGAHKLQQEGHEVAAVGVDHNHNEDSNHGAALSDADLIAAKKLYEETGIDHMGLTINGRTGADGTIAVQHKMVADHTGDLRTLEGEEGSGKVVSLFTDRDGTQTIEYSANIEEAQKKQEIVELKKQLMAA